MTPDLVERLRQRAEMYDHRTAVLITEAADAIASLSRDLEEANALLTKAWLYTDLRQFQNEIVAFQQRLSSDNRDPEQKT